MNESHALRAIKRKITAFKHTYGHPPRIMLLSETEGTFGHARITSILAQRIKEAGAEVVVVSGDIDEHIFSFGDNLKTLPKVIHTFKDGQVSVTTPKGTLYKDDPEYIALRRKELLSIADDFKPDLIAFEFHPIAYKAFRVPDVETLLHYKKETGAHIPFVTIARDSTMVNIQGKRLEALKDFDRILLRGWKDIPWKNASPIPPEVTEKTETLGHIHIRHTANDNSIPSDEQPVMVFASGGYQENDHLFFETAIKASKEGDFSHRPWKIVLSEDCPADVFKKFQELAEKEGNGKITVTHTYNSHDFSNDLAHCAGAIVRGSYNITLELTSLGKPFVTIPRTIGGFSLENKGRAQFFAQNGIATTIDEADLSENGGQKLAAALHEATQIKPVKEFHIEDGSQFASRLSELAMEAKKRKPIIQQMPWQEREQVKATRTNSIE